LRDKLLGYSTPPDADSWDAISKGIGNSMPERKPFFYQWQRPLGLIGLVVLFIGIGYYWGMKDAHKYTTSQKSINNNGLVYNPLDTKLSERLPAYQSVNSQKGVAESLSPTNQQIADKLTASSKPNFIKDDFNKDFDARIVQNKSNNAIVSNKGGSFNKIQRKNNNQSTISIKNSLTNTSFNKDVNNSLSNVQDLNQPSKTNVDLFNIPLQLVNTEIPYHIAKNKLITLKDITPKSPNTGTKGWYLMAGYTYQVNKLNKPTVNQANTRQDVINALNNTNFKLSSTSLGINLQKFTPNGLVFSQSVSYRTTTNRQQNRFDYLDSVPGIDSMTLDTIGYFTFIRQPTASPSQQISKYIDVSTKIGYNVSILPRLSIGGSIGVEAQFLAGYEGEELSMRDFKTILKSSKSSLTKLNIAPSLEGQIQYSINDKWMLQAQFGLSKALMNNYKSGNDYNYSTSGKSVKLSIGYKISK
jgi:hypothetical protein